MNTLVAAFAVALARIVGPDKVYVGAPTLVIGPGEAQMAHQTDEYCHMERIRQSVAIYAAIIRDWCRA